MQGVTVISISGGATFTSAKRAAVLSALLCAIACDLYHNLPLPHAALCNYALALTYNRAELVRTYNNITFTFSFNKVGYRENMHSCRWRAVKSQQYYVNKKCPPSVRPLNGRGK